MSWKAQVRVVNDAKWYGNGLRFATEQEADGYGFNLSMRWSAAEDYRIVETDDPVTHKTVDGRVEVIEVAV